MKNHLPKFACLVFVMASACSIVSARDNTISMGPDYNTSEKINFNALNQTDERTEVGVESNMLNFKAESIRDTKRKSFHSLRNVEELHEEDMIVIK